jgi:hypothetical protein
VDVNVRRKELKSNGDLNLFLKTDGRQPVREVMLTEVSTITKLTLNEAKWSDVVVGKRKKFAYRRWENTYQIPVKKSLLLIL